MPVGSKTRGEGPAQTPDALTTSPSHPHIFAKRYQIIEELGRGGMGRVLRARDLKLGREVALKLLVHGASDTFQRQRFEQEARAAGALNHPNILAVHDVGEEDGEPYIVTELLEGRNLRSALCAGPFTSEDALRLASQLADGLAAAHAKGIVHRDLKPENLFLTSEGRLKILDFGIAKHAPPTGAVSITDSGAVMGTVGYMSPEQVRGERADPRSDVFSFGAVLHEMLTGRPVFERRSTLETGAAILHDPVPELPEHVPAALAGIVRRCLEKNAQDRFESARELAPYLVSLSGGAAAPQARITPSAPKRHTVGREEEKAQLLSAFEHAAGGRGLLTCVSGEPGIGKTTLVDEFLSDLQHSGRRFRIARGRCSERLAGSEAYLPFLDALENLLRSSSQDGALKMRTLAPSWYAQLFTLAESDPLRIYVKAATQERVKRELGTLLEDFARAEPLILFLDDLHWADSSTIDLLAYLMTRFDRARILIVGTYRPSDLILAKHPFLQVKRDLQARSLCREVAVELLPVEEVERYLALEFVDHRFPGELAGLIHSRTEGNPLFMADVLRYLRDRKAIVQGEEGWSLLQRLPDLDLPQSVRSMIERKIEQVGDRDREILVAAAVEGHEFDSAALARALQADGLEIEERLESLDRVHAFAKRVAEEELPDGTLTVRYRFVHVLYQNALYASLSPARRAALSAALARALEGLHRDKTSGIASRLGFLYETARDFARAAHCFGLAAKSAAAIFANAEAVALARRGLDLVKKVPGGPERIGKELELQMTFAFAGRFTLGYGAEETRVAIARAYEICQSLGDIPQLFPVLWGVCVYRYTSADLASARTIAEQLLGIAIRTNDPYLLVAAHCVAGWTAFLQGDAALGLGEFEEAGKLYDPAKSSHYFQLFGMDPGVYALSGWALALWFTGSPDRASQKMEEALAVARGTVMPSQVAFALMIACGLQYFLRRPQVAKELGDECLALCEERGIISERMWISPYHGWALAELGQVEQGLSEIRAARDLARSTGQLLGMGSTYPVTLAATLLQVGNSRDALSALEDGLAFSEQKTERYYEPELWRVRGEILGDESCFEKAIETARRGSAKSLELRASMSLARSWARRGKRDEARKMLGEIYGWFSEGFDTTDVKDAAALLAELA
jgi:tetratricopeptide (TPR) repeat protein